MSVEPLDTEKYEVLFTKTFDPSDESFILKDALDIFLPTDLPLPIYGYHVTAYEISPYTGLTQIWSGIQNIIIKLHQPEIEDYYSEDVDPFPGLIKQEIVITASDQHGSALLAGFVATNNLEDNLPSSGSHLTHLRSNRAIGVKYRRNERLKYNGLEDAGFYYSDIFEDVAHYLRDFDMDVLPSRVDVKVLTLKSQETRHDAREREARDEFESRLGQFTRTPDVGGILETNLDMTPQLRGFMRKNVSSMERQIIREQRELQRKEDADMEAIWKQQQQSLIASQSGKQPTLREWESSLREKIKHEVATDLQAHMLTTGTPPSAQDIDQMADNAANHAISEFRKRPLPSDPMGYGGSNKGEDPDSKRRRAEARLIGRVLRENDYDVQKAAAILRSKKR